jgi:uncharacterized spore protein YtfJ
LVRKGQRAPDKTRVKPVKVIKVASGTIRILAKTVIGEKIWKLSNIIPDVPNQAENETRLLS